MIGQRRVSREISTEDSIRLLASVPFGRVVFTSRALPDIQPVTHLVESGDLIIRTHLDTVTAAAHARVVVAYQADAIDPRDHMGWSVVAVGTAAPVDDLAEQERYRRLLGPWVDGSQDCLIRIRPAIITGFEVVDAALTAAQNGQ
jgi:hypothetical protein